MDVESKLAGVDDENIAKDYALTRIGREPKRAMIMERLSKEPLFASNNEAALNMFTCRSVSYHRRALTLKSVAKARNNDSISISS